MRSWKPTPNMSCNDIIQCIFDLNHHDIAIFNILLKKGNLRVQTLAQQLNKDRSTIYRSLQKLTNCSICEKKTHHLPKGGYYHTYCCADLDHVRKEMKICINQWYETMQETITHLESDLQ